MTTDLILYLSLFVNLIILILLLFRNKTVDTSVLTRMEAGIKEEFRNNRAENATLAKDNRIELNNTLLEINRESRESLAAGLKDFTFEQRNKFDDLKNEQKELRNRTVEQLEKINEKLTLTIREFQESFEKNILNMNNLQREKFQQLEEKQVKLIESTEKKLEEMRATVDEKLQKTLNERIGQSFEIVGKQLESVQKGLGEMQTIAQEVGGLKKVLSNVKLRGGVGEVQLAMLLEQILAPNQYDANVKTKAGSSEPVEFAIKLPGRSEEENSFVYLPIDAKFPKDVYETLINAYENAVPEDIETAAKAMEATIRKMARDIRDKYIDPPHTTDFAILFLPFEGIYAEVIRRTALVDQLRDEFKITVAGPTTLVALLNSLQMGFRTLALQKRSSEVWKVLGAVKTEFEKFGGLLEKAQKNLHSASDTVDELLGKRSRAITRRLKNVEALPAAEAQQLLPDINNELLEEEGD
ncbi:DNA recombination protein RmuC [Flavihumibacter sp. RY-1]|uniref:DNA recombination protein RmuC n=1 Tax=Flavihumibacter fluminis TaxID=2909236 RepID=A0ABS9BNT9_9BACT|nr:DNA recombination protein RmuC [Flavihumibacter fluminis]MCF1716722.1 DNA recombination protein RmuC [Flavihumibacter fluminis]